MNCKLGRSRTPEPSSLTLDSLPDKACISLTLAVHAKITSFHCQELHIYRFNVLKWVFSQGPLYCWQIPVR